MAQQSLSPLVQVTQTPSLVISHLHMPMHRLQQPTIMPFIMQQQLHMPPASIEHRLCMVVQAIVSVQVQVIFMPPVDFSILKVHFGTIIMLGGIIVGVMPGVVPGMVPMPVMPIAARSIIIVDMPVSPCALIGPLPSANTAEQGLPSLSPREYKHPLHSLQPSILPTM